MSAIPRAGTDASRRGDELKNLGCYMRGRSLELPRFEGQPSYCCERQDLSIEMLNAGIAPTSDFHQRLFAWNIRQRSNGSTFFDDTTGEWKFRHLPNSANFGN